jgi:bifunctional DNase/RNase
MLSLQKKNILTEIYTDMDKIAIKINCILNWNNDYARMLIMQTVDNKISFPIIIADNEAASLFKEMEQVEVKRPQTHDLFFTFLQTFGVHIEEVYIHKLIEGIFYTQITCSVAGKIVVLDARPSDAIILALKEKAPIFVEKNILEKLGIATTEMEKQITHSGDDDQGKEEIVFDDMSDEDLKNLLKQAIEIEDFEMASQIRDVLKQRKEN